MLTMTMLHFKVYWVYWYVNCLLILFVSFVCGEGSILYLLAMNYLYIGCSPNSLTLFELVQPYLLQNWCSGLMSGSFPNSAQ